MSTYNSQAQAHGFYHGGLTCKLPTFVSFSAVALRSGAKFYHIKRENLKSLGVQSSQTAYFFSFLQACSFYARLCKGFNLSYYFLPPVKTFFSKKLQKNVHAVICPSLEIPYNFQNFYKSFSAVSRNYQKDIQQKLYQKVI